MADKPAQIAKESKGFGKRLEKLLRFGSRSTPHSRSNSPHPSVAPSAVTVASSPVVAMAPLVSSPHVGASAPLPPPPAIAAPLVNPAPLGDLVRPTDPAPPIDPGPPINPAQTITITPEEAAKLRARYTRFRILVIGRANAGKTTLLKRVCKTDEDPVYNSVSYQFR